MKKILVKFFEVFVKTFALLMILLCIISLFNVWEGNTADFRIIILLIAVSAVLSSIIAFVWVVGDIITANKSKHESSKTPGIPEPPEETPLNIQTNGERKNRLSRWENLLKGLPYCTLEKGINGFTDKTGFVAENPDTFGDCRFIVSLHADLSYHPSVFCILYFCFTAGGFWIYNHNNYESCDFTDIVAEEMLEFYAKKPSAETWAKGYNLIKNLLKDIYGEENEVPELPKE